MVRLIWSLHELCAIDSYVPCQNNLGCCFSFMLLLLEKVHWILTVIAVNFAILSAWLIFCSVFCDHLRILFKYLLKITLLY
jgi:hypothetical protein